MKKNTNVTKLSDRDRDRFLEMLEEDEPNDNLKKAVERCNELTEDDD